LTATIKSAILIARSETIMNLYDRWILPPILDFAMRQQQLDKYRREVVAAAKGRVLEVGVGSGLNFPFYGGGVEVVVGLDPSPRLLAKARRRAAAAGVRAGFLQGSATAIPLENHTIDSVVMTWTLCSIPDPLAALREMRRVLKPGGRLLFVEHGLSPEPGIERWQHRLTPIWCHIAGGCHLDRKMDDLIRATGFALTELRTEYANGPRPMTYMYVGCASVTESAG
jgi:ubiquinone/menaquinone biosynthesis C-methylase UbiE